MDNLDMKILSRLLNNCRESDRQIGKELGLSGGAVRARIKKMQESGVIEEFVIKIEPPTLGHGVLYFVVSGENIQEILEQVSLVGEPYIVVPCIGGVTVCGIAIQEKLEQKIDLAKKLMKDLRVLSIFEAENSAFNSNLTKTDLEILEELIKEPRQKIEKIAKNTNLSTKTVTRCIEKLHDNDGFQFTLIYDPKKIEDFIPHAVLTWIDGDLKDALENLNNTFSESYLQIPFIAKNQIVLFLYSDSIFKMDELTQKVRTSKNVKSADLFIPKKISFYTNWIKKSIEESKKSPKLHLTYQTN
ncbi:winged helix-turn-helix transcriptional regulator [Candidatus Nitrosopumilus sp. SW]|uniref:winged helix-turn-helix transcriptional regulator n=1 Tax=Candidatus Nitrosopumilus sp. SW TaxID=2508726 RepID=UPI001154247F|nr:winged helix-turn-helix transcriptional regulator [Candidatus Nitrosopumilus sp. SW]QDI89011.1 winged helix-turn-helix transcriptional regulator [Candidatus Nitrosopumilus sp. SW]